MSQDRERLLARRLAAQGLSTIRFADPADVARGLTAVQAQEPAGASWAIAQRLASPSRAAVAAALDSGELLRTHVLRPTWHVVARDDLRWMQTATGERVEKAVGTWYRQLGLDASEFARTDAIIEAAIRRDGERIRPELTAELADAGIDIADAVRVQHILMHAEVTSLIVSGAKRGKQETYGLVENRAPAASALDPAAPLAELARRYLAGHGPATVRDLSWWSGMTLTAARAAVASIEDQLRSDTLDDVEYWSLADAPDAVEPTGILLLPAYDEFVVGYADRALFTPEGFTGNPVFQNVIVQGGVIIGTWNPKADDLSPSLIGSVDRGLLDVAIDRYRGFRG